MQSVIGFSYPPKLKKLFEFYETCETYESDELIFSTGQKVKGIYTIKSGKVKVTIDNNTDEELIVRLARDGEILGHRGFGGDWKYPISAYALTETTLSFLPLDVFKTIARSNAEFTYQIFLFFAQELRRSEDRVSHLQVKNRIARFIFRNYEAFGFEDSNIGNTGKLSFSLSRKDFALQAGTTYETTVRAIAKLAKDRVIETDGKDIIIRDLKRLREEARIFN